ncbi:MAG TPA: hypothetical protein VGQ24_12635 [Gemmatimonadales bacterium]|nr:hypothetical protein [Gemmatimonadales bacterium]
MSGYRVGSALLIVGLCGTVAAEGQGREFPFHYAVKLVCGIQRERGGVVPQSYATTINIHNPSDSVAQFVKSWVMTLPPGGQRPMKPRRLSVDTLGPTLALATDCVDVHRRSGSGVPPFFEGFVLIDSSHSLDVVAVYSVPGGIDIVHVPERSRFR